MIKKTLTVTQLLVVWVSEDESHRNPRIVHRIPFKWIVTVLTLKHLPEFIKEFYNYRILEFYKLYRCCSTRRCP